MHKIVISKLGPIDQTTLTCKDFMVLTGGTAVGKSTLAKAIFYFRTVKEDVLSLLIKKASGLVTKELAAALTDFLEKKFLDVFGSLSLMNQELVVEYFYTQEVSIRVGVARQTEHFRFSAVGAVLSEEIQSALAAWGQDLGAGVRCVPEEEKQALRKDLSALFNDAHRVVFIPAGRTVATVLGAPLNYLYAMMDDTQKQSVDFCTRSYLETVLRLRPEFENGFPGLESRYPNRRLSEEAMACVRNILKGSYMHSQGIDYLKVDGGPVLRVNYASSGQQEALWIVNLLYYHLLQGGPAFFMIEEPEAHLDPKEQHALMELVSVVRAGGHRVLLTTGSEEILERCENANVEHV